MKSSKNCKVTAAFLAAAALGGVAHAEPTLNMNDLVGTSTSAESTTQSPTSVATPVVKPIATQPVLPATPQPATVVQQQTPPMAQPQPSYVMQPATVSPVQTQQVTPLQSVPQQVVPMQSQQQVQTQPQYVVNKDTKTVMEPTLAMHSLINVQRKTEPVTVEKPVDGKQQVQTTQVERTPVVIQQESIAPLTVSNTTVTKAVVAKQRLTIRDIQRAERERLAQLAAEEASQQENLSQADQQQLAQKQAEAQWQAALQSQQQAEAQRQAALQAEQERVVAQQAEAQRQAALRAEQERIAAQQAEQARIAEERRQAAELERIRIQEEQRRIAEQQAEQERIAAQQAEAQRQAAIRAEQERIAAQQAEAQRQAAIKAEQERIAAQQAEAQRQAAIRAEQERLAAQQAEAQRQAAIKAEQERIAAQQAEAQRQAAIKAEQERIAAQQAEAERQAALKAEQERIATQQAEAQRQAAIKAEQERIAAQQAEAQRQAAIKAEQERIAAQQAEAQRQAAIKAEQERIAAQRAEAQRQAALKAERERILAQQAEEERLAAEEAARQRAEAAAKAEAERQAVIRAEQERMAAQQAEAQRQAAIKAEQERIAAQQAESQRQAALKAEQERIAAEKAKAEREAAIKAEQERIAAKQAELARQAVIQEEQERLAAEQLAKEEAAAAAKAQAEAEAKAKAEADAAAKARAEAEAKAKAEVDAAAKAQAEAEAKAKAQSEAEAKAKSDAETKQVQESKLPQSYVNARNEASTKGSTVTEEKNILSQPIEPPLQADASAKISLAFDAKNYESMSTTVDNKEIKYRAFEYIPYVANPIDIDQQYMNIYVPEEYFNNGTINGYNTQTAPIFMPNAVGGYMPSQAMTPKVENGKPNSVLYALSRGYVVASPSTRGRTNKASDGNFIGKAPAVIVDLQAATAYLHANDSAMPGNANRIITNGTSAGGGVSLLQGATGNSSDFQPYLQALGAATAATNVYAVSAYAPITNLDAADMAYEWSYNGITSFNKVTMGQGELPQANVGGNSAPPQRTMQRVNLNADDLSYSKMLSEHFPDYVNNLQLRDSLGRVLKLDKNGNGTFKNYVKEFIVAAANKAAAKGTDLSKHTYLVRDNKTGTIKDINWEAYNHFVSRSKAPGAFDSRANDTGENNLFGTSTTDNNHFTITAALHDSTANQDVYVENAKIVTMMNPMNYLGSPAATNARFYRIRYGTADSNTSVAIPLIVGTRAQNLGYRVDMATPFNVDHSGDYDLEELFNWMDNIVKNGR
ncbi:MAG: subtype B tannase [Veillonella sp.]|uniref:subtype B tannase n=1 Tax=Veillonella sp. TaxID=1926307 RepID=UPI00257D0DD0|nr:subtype B tannase [Veillonella sp.]MBS5067099.1 ATPase [Veillonella sp.]MDU1826699.1 subtype B tannase [Veillonella sp.]